MFFLLLVSVLFRVPLTFLILVGGNGGQKWSANEQAKDVDLVHTVQLKPMIKAQISGKMISSGISDVTIASVYSEKTRLKKMIMIIIIMNLSQETMVFGGRQKLTSAIETKTRKVMVDFKFDALYR